MADSQIQELLAQARPRAGKGAARATRRAGKIPAVIYGDKKDPQTISIDNNELLRLLRGGVFMTSVYDIKLDGQSVRALPRDIQFHPVKDLPIHVDFQRVSGDGRIRISVPVEIINDEDAPGIKNGGVVNMVRHEIEIICPAEAIPSSLVVDLAGAEIGDSFHISSVNLPPDVEPTITDRDFTIVTIAGASAVVEEDEAEEGDEEGAEGEAAEGEEAAAEGDGDDKGDEENS